MVEQDPLTEIAGLTSRSGALRQAATLPGADLGSLLDAALAELDAAIDALKAAAGATANGSGSGAGEAVHAERRLLHTVFQQAPVPLFLLAGDGTVRRVNAAAGELLGSGPGYATGKLFAAFIDPASRAAVQTLLAAAARTGEQRQLRCSVLTGQGAADRVLAVRQISIRGDLDQLVVAAGVPDTGRATGKSRPAGARRAQQAEPDAGVVAAMTRRLDLVTGATRILLENVTYSEPVAVQQCARLLARELDAWVVVDVEQHQHDHRQLPDRRAAQRVAAARRRAAGPVR